MRRYLALPLACVLAAISVSALAMGLGEIRLNSYLNQRLNAEIELVSAAADELESLKVRLADSSAFERYGLDRTAFLNNLQFRVVRRPNGTAYVHVTSTEPVREPFLTFLLEADWSRGRLLREYTLLLDPPTFANREQPAPQTQAPAVEPQAEAVQRAPERVQPEVVQPRIDEREPAEQPAEERFVEETRGDVVDIPSLDEERLDAPARSAATYPRQTEDSYGPIQRNETLWGIAQRLRPDDSISVNQMMLALYRANPEAFQGNINRLKAGYILRVPRFDEITSMSRGEAFNEVKRQNDEWRYGGASPAAAQPPIEAEPELSLVAPEEDLAPEAGTGVGAGGESEDLGMGAEEPADPAQDDVEEDAVDLGVEEDTADRLLDIEDESLQALQEQEDATAEGELTAPPLPAETVEEEPIAQEPATEEQAAEETVTPATETPEAGQTEPERTVPIVPVRRPQPTLMEQVLAFVKEPLGMGVIAAILVLLLAGVLIARRRSAAAASGAGTTTAWIDDETSDDATVAVGRDEDEDVTIIRDDDAGDMAAVFAHDLGREDTGTTRIEDDEDARALMDGGKTQLVDAGAPDFSETVVGGQAVTLDENDPLSEADFHMAYGLYDQAAEVVERAVERDPSRKDYHAKLAEIHFAANNTEGFLESARRLRELSGPGDAAWDNVAIMGRQIAPGNDLFADAGTTSSVDLDFGTAGEEFGEETVVNPDTAPVDDALDFDVSFGDRDEPAAPPADAQAGESDDTDLGDFDLELGDLGEDSADAGLPSETAADDFAFDLDDTGSENAGVDSNAGNRSMMDEEETQTEFDKALQELSAFVDTNLPEQDAGDAVQDEGLSLDDYSFDEDASALEDELAGTGEDEEDIGEIGTKLDLARAYIDMGDPDGARGILEEVLSDGDADQQKEARDLLEQLA